MQFSWKHIQFEDGGNPYICTTDKAFRRLAKKYNLIMLKENFYLAKGKE